jgi:alpha-tubulin suppressor-like RCC1 family protein
VQVFGPNGVGILTGITSVGAGQYHSVAVRGADGTVWAWGNNFDGELGDLSGANQNTPVQVVITQSGGQALTGISVVASRNSHTLAIRRSDGSVWAWGLNTYGQLGSGNVSSFRGAAQVVGVGGVGFLTGIVAISAGDNFSVAIDSSGNVYAWGDDSAGQLGDNRFGSGVISTTPLRVHGLNNVGTLSAALAVASRANGSDALNSDHTLAAWGTGNQPQSIYPVIVPGAGGAGTLFPMVGVGAGYNTTMTVDPTAALWDWGDNTFGQLGDGTTTFRANAVQVLDVGGGPNHLTGVVAATGGLNHSLALRSDGTVVAWGSNVSGQLGDGSTTDRLTPVQTIIPIATQPAAC